jgi:glucosylceramidase
MTGPNTGLAEVKGNSVASSGRLWAFASYSRFVRPGAVRIGATTNDARLEVSAFRNRDGSIAVIALNRARSRQTATFSLRGLGRAQVTSYLTDAAHHLARQTPKTLRDSAFSSTQPARSLITYDIRS